MHILGKKKDLKSVCVNLRKLEGEQITSKVNRRKEIVEIRKEAT